VVGAVVGEVGAIPDPTPIIKISGAAGEAVVEVVEGVGEVAVEVGVKQRRSISPKTLKKTIFLSLTTRRKNNLSFSKRVN